MICSTLCKITLFVFYIKIDKRGAWMKRFLITILLLFIPVNSFSGDDLEQYKIVIKDTQLQKNLNTLYDIDLQIRYAINHNKPTNKELPAYLEAISMLDIAYLIVYYEYQLYKSITWIEAEDWLPVKYKESKDRWQNMRERLERAMLGMEHYYSDLSNTEILNLVDRALSVIKISITDIDSFYKKYLSILSVKEVYQKLPSGEVVTVKLK
jgi:hypothetical protein